MCRGCGRRFPPDEIRQRLPDAVGRRGGGNDQEHAFASSGGTAIAFEAGIGNGVGLAEIGAAPRRLGRERDAIRILLPLQWARRAGRSALSQRPFPEKAPATAARAGLGPMSSPCRRAKKANACG